VFSEVRYEFITYLSPDSSVLVLASYAKENRSWPSRPE
jgi:hypothetical protein